MTMTDRENYLWENSIFRRDRHAKKRKLEFVRVEDAGALTPNLQEYERDLNSPHIGCGFLSHTDWGFAALAYIPIENL